MKTSLLFPTLVGLGLMLGVSGAGAATLAADLSSPRSAGTTIVFTIGGAIDPRELYRMSIAAETDPGNRRVFFDYSLDNVLEWTPIDPGNYLVTASLWNPETGQERFAQQRFRINPAVPPAFSSPVALPTRHPLVALYVAPPCQASAFVRVRFVAATGGVEQATSPKPCEPGMPTHFLVAGLRENSLYWMWHETLGPHAFGAAQTSSTSFATGPAWIAISPNRLVIPADGRASQAESLIWNSPLIGNQGLGLSPYIHATDLEGHLVWYLDEISWSLRPSDGGTFWTVKRDPVTGMQDHLLAKVDLLGNVLRQTSVLALNLQLQRLGYSDRINDIHHDVRDLPNGDIAFISTVERLVTDLQGPGEVSVLGDMILVTNPDFEIQWVWNGWDHLDPTRLATLGEVCAAGAAGCPPFFLADQSNDWMHSNGLAYTPDGNLMLSVRHQDWILKIDYADGAGDGHILWRLGPEGDFRLLNGDEDQWFSHTHDANFIADNRILLFDNSNRRCASATPPPDCQSRGQVWEIDERAMTAELVFNRDLGEFANAVGSAQPLRNGHYWFNSGLLGTFTNPRATILEVEPDATSVFRIDLDIFQYRSYRLSDLYSAPRYWETPAHPRGGRPENCARKPGRECKARAFDPEGFGAVR